MPLGLILFKIFFLNHQTFTTKTCLQNISFVLLNTCILKSNPDNNEFPGNVFFLFMMFINKFPELFIYSSAAEKYQQKLTGKPWYDFLVYIQSIYDEKFNNKTVTLSKTFHQPVLGGVCTFFCRLPTDNIQSHQGIISSTN